MTGIYKITNIINGKAYIGQSIDIDRRWKTEKADSNNKNSHSYDYPLMRAFRKYGLDSFKFEIIEECCAEELNQKEVYWIEYFDTFFHGYNQTFGGDTSSRQPKENVIGVISDLANTDMSHRDIAIKWCMSTEMVQGINTGRYWRHNADYPIQKKQSTAICYCKKCGKEITKGSELCMDCYSIVRTAASNRPDKETLIKDISVLQSNFVKIGKKYGVTDNTVRNWCIRYGIPSKSSDYKTTKNPKEKIRNYKTAVIQFDINTGEELGYYESATEAVMKLGSSANCGTHILDVCRGKRKTAYGYKWKFA